MSQYVIPSRNPGHQRQEQVEGEEGNRSSHVHNEQNQPRTAPFVHMFSNDITELIWENGQLAMHGNGRLFSTTPTKPTWNKAGDTLESLVQQATCQKETPHITPQDHTPVNIPSLNGASSGRQRAKSSSQRQDAPALMRKQARSDSEPRNGRRLCGRIHNIADGSACVSGSSASGTLCRDNDTTKNTWASFESGRSLTTKATDEDSSCHHSGSSTRRSRAAVIHNQSERKRRDRINQKMKTLQKLVPNASKTDKASMLDEVIEYLKQLQAQVQVMSARNMSQMMMSLGVQQHLQMPPLAQMGMGVGLGMSMGMLDMANTVHSAPQTLPSLIHPASGVASAPTFVSPPFVLPRLIPTHAPAQAKLETGNNAQVHLPDPYGAFLAQSMNMDMYNKMTALHGQQVNQTRQALSNPSQTHHVQPD